MGFIDIHCHILPGLDDGPETVEESLEMLQMAKDDGITHIFCTPHVYPGVYDTDTQTIARARDELKKSGSNGVKLLLGGDVRITPDLPERVSKQIAPTLNGSQYLLVEFPSQIMPHYISALIFSLRQKGLIPIITHPERCMYFASDFTTLKVLREQGCMFQITAMSITKDAGKGAQRVALNMIERGFGDFVATDAHSTGRRSPVLSKAYKEIQDRFGKKVAHRLFFENPFVILQSIKE